MTHIKTETEERLVLKWFYFFHSGLELG
jgi:hypothetical protein